MFEKNAENKKNSEKQHEESESNEIIPGYRSFEDFTKAGYKTLMEAIRNSNSLPSGSDWNFYSTYDSFLNALNDNKQQIMSDITLILRKNELRSNMRTSSFEHQTELLVEANDVILERVANNIDEMNGIRKTINEPVVLQTVSAYLPINGSWNRMNNATFSVTSSGTLSGVVQQNKNAKTIRLLTAENILRPQKFFKDIINNSNKSPWEPRIKDKPNSLKPLALFLESTENGEEFSHPYEFELDHFTPSPECLQKADATLPKPVEDTPVIEIDKPEQLDELVDKLRGYKEIAVDLEHHSYRSFMGITCLMQISTKDEDYLIDTLALRDKLYVLNEVFTKPSIIKILHGASGDIQWLQRDLSLYIVNMFDTYIAAKLLNYSSLSLASLMQKFCAFMPNKQFQLADWRIRPLPDELKSYAREDTHYLIYIYQMMKNELIEKANDQDNLLQSVFQQSTELCKKRYFKPILKEDSHLEFYRRCNRLFDNRQLYALKHLYKWRDEISREEDESTGYVLPNNMLLEVSERLPREMQGILACCNPVPPLVRSSLLDLHKIILKALEQPFEEPILKEDIRERGTTKKMSKINVDSPLYCPHDLTKNNDFRDDLPTLLENKSSVSIVESAEVEAVKSKWSVFNTPDNSDNEPGHDAFKLVHRMKFLGPYERYKLVKPFIKAREEKLAAEKAKEEEKGKQVSSEPIEAGGEAKEDTRTDEERIECIKEHFLGLLHRPPPEPLEEPPQETQGEYASRQTRKNRTSKSPSPPEFLNMSLRELGGSSRKRKRDKSEDNNTSETDPNNSRSEDELHTPVPNFNRKRKSSPFTVDTTPSKVAKSGEPKSLNKNKNQRKKIWKKNKKRNGNNQNNQQQGTSREDNSSHAHTPQRLQEGFESGDFEEIGNDNRNRGRNNRSRGSRGGHNQDRGSRKQNRGRQSQDREDDNEDQVGHDIHRGNRNERGGRNVRRGRNNRARGSRNQRGRGQSRDRGGSAPGEHQQNESFSAYDYASVDFRQFQGGAGGADRPKQVKSTFKSKGKKKNANRGQNRMQSFRGTGKFK